MKTIALKNDQVDELMGAGDEEVVITVNGRTVALVIPMDDEELHFYKIENSAEFIESIARARKEIQEGKGMDLESVKREFGLK